MDAECRFEVCNLMEVVLEALFECLTVGSDKVSLHLCFADLAVSETKPLCSVSALVWPDIDIVFSLTKLQCNSTRSLNSHLYFNKFFLKDNMKLDKIRYIFGKKC